MTNGKLSIDYAIGETTLLQDIPRAVLRNSTKPASSAANVASVNIF